MQRLVTLCLALSLVATQANAIVGGAEDEGPLARQSVMVLSSNGGVCSAVVLAKDVVLTAAHCVTGAAEHRVHFRDETGEPVLIVPSAKAVHPGYDAKAIENRRRSVDLALLRVPERLPDRFERATLANAKPAKDVLVAVGGYGLSQEKTPKNTSTVPPPSPQGIQPHR